MHSFYSFIFSLFLLNSTFYCAAPSPDFVNKAETARKEDNQQKAEVIFFDVGQGHCTLVSVPGEPLLLVDAGSTKRRGSTEDEKLSFQNIQIDKIQKKIKYLLTNQKAIEEKYIINVVISHGDADHFNWINEIFSNDFISTNKVKLNIICGGNENQYAGDIKTWVKKHTYHFVEGKELSNVNSQFHTFFPTDSKPCSILAAKNTPNKNTNSIVAKCTYGGKSVLLTGDATADTVDQIQDAKAQILQIPHHGADTDGSNDESLYKSVKPEFIVASSGNKHNHPRYKALESFMKNKQEVQVAPHIVSFNMPHSSETGKSLDVLLTSVSNDNLLSFMVFSSHYILYITKLGIYGTTNSGDITFIWNDSTPTIQVTTARGLELGKAVQEKSIKELVKQILSIGSILTNELSDDSMHYSLRFPANECLAIKLPKDFNAANILTPGEFKWSDIYELDASDITFDSTYDPAVFLTHMRKLRRFVLPGSLPVSLPDWASTIKMELAARAIK